MLLKLVLKGHFCFMASNKIFIDLRYAQKEFKKNIRFAALNNESYLLVNSNQFNPYH